jgi:hypothetical protein
MSGEGAEGEKRSKQDRIRQGPFKGHFGYLIRDVFKDEIEGGLIFDEDIHFLEKENDNIDEGQAAQAQAEELQEFSNDIPVENPVALKHFRRNPSTSVE